MGQVNRRDFLGGLAGILAACTAPQALVGQQFKWRAHRPIKKVEVVGIRINPAWRDATFEVMLMCRYDQLRELKWNRQPPAVTEVTPIVFKRSAGIKPVLEARPGEVAIVGVDTAIDTAVEEIGLGIRLKPYALPFRFDHDMQLVQPFIEIRKEKT